MLNPKKKFVKSEGVDLPVMYVYLAGRIAGNCIDKCLKWRQDIIKHYANYKGQGTYPIAFLDALNSKESDSVDKRGLTSAIPPNLIYDKDLLSVQTADVVVANMNDFMDVDIKDLLAIPNPNDYKEGDYYPYENFDFREAFFRLQDVIKNRRPNYGTNSEVAWALLLKKPLILIADDETRKRILELHPFMKRASVIVESVEELLGNKWLNILYKSMASSIY